MVAHHDKVVVIVVMGQVLQSRLQKSVQSALFRGVRLGLHSPLRDRVPRGK